MSSFRTLIATLALLAAGLVAPALTMAPAHASVPHASAAKHTCTKKPNGTCIRRGQVCAKAKKGHVGWDNRGRKNICRGKGAHPHWRAPAKKKHGGGGQHACTRTSSGSCIQGGEFCPQSKYGQSGWDNRGHRYVCKGDHTHPHWKTP
jgi:hypothetical protein